MANRSSDISVNTLEELVKTHGDKIVTGFVRFKKVKKCKGYDSARDAALIRFSKISGGRMIGENEYAAVISLRWLLLFILLILALLIWGLLKIKPKAQIRDPETTGIIETIAEYETDTEETRPDTMDIPGFCDMHLSEENREIVLYNPQSNNCKLLYQFIVGDNCFYKSSMLKPGDMTFANIYDSLHRGVYRMEIVTTGIGDNEEQLNSVSQTIILKVE